jgi:hypothetical protein
MAFSVAEESLLWNAGTRPWGLQANAGRKIAGIRAGNIFTAAHNPSDAFRIQKLHNQKGMGTKAG